MEQKSRFLSGKLGSCETSKNREPHVFLSLGVKGGKTETFRPCLNNKRTHKMNMKELV